MTNVLGDSNKVVNSEIGHLTFIIIQVFQTVSNKGIIPIKYQDLVHLITEEKKKNKTKGLLIDNNYNTVIERYRRNYKLKIFLIKPKHINIVEINVQYNIGS